MQTAPSNPATNFRDDIVALLPHMRAFARSLAKHRENAEDLVGDTIVRALGAEHLFTPGTNLRAWVFTIMRNIWFNRGREMAKKRAVPLDDIIGVGTAETATDRIRLREMEVALNSLPPIHLEVIMLAADGLTYEQIADEIDMEIGTAKSRVSRARTALRDRMSEFA